MNWLYAVTERLRKKGWKEDCPQRHRYRYSKGKRTIYLYWHEKELVCENWKNGNRVTERTITDVREIKCPSNDVKSVNQDA